MKEMKSKYPAYLGKSDEVSAAGILVPAHVMAMRIRTDPSAMTIRNHGKIFRLALRRRPNDRR